MRVSVIVPNYNHARFLVQRLDSIRQQSISDFELILLDDASTDDSVPIMERYVGGRTRLLRNNQNSGGPFAQWRKGLGEAKGEFIWIAESDDFAAPQFLECLLAALEANPGVGLAFCQSRVVDEAGQVGGLAMDGERENRYSDWRQSYVSPGIEELRRQLRLPGNSIPNASGVLFRRSAIDDAGEIDSQLRLTGDWMLYGRILRNTQVAFVAQPLNFWRQVATSAGTRAMRSGQALPEIYRGFHQIARWAQAEDRDLRTARSYCATLWVVALIQARRQMPTELRGAIRQAAAEFDPAYRSRLVAAIVRHAWTALGRRLSPKPQSAAPNTSR